MGIRHIRRWTVVLLPGALLLFCPSCQDSGVIHPRVVDALRPPAIVLKSTTYLLREPRLLEEDYVYPAGISRQRLVWNDRGEEWIVRLAGAQYAFGGIMFRRSYDFSENQPEFGLMFSVQPAEMIPYLSVGLVDGDRRGPRVMTDVPLASRVTGRLGPWAHVVVRLDDLSDEGTVVGGDHATRQSEQQRMDWGDIREIRFTGLADKRPDLEITIRNLRFAPVSAKTDAPKSETTTPESAPTPRPASAP